MKIAAQDIVARPGVAYTAVTASNTPCFALGFSQVTLGTVAMMVLDVVVCTDAFETVDKLSRDKSQRLHISWLFVSAARRINDLVRYSCPIPT